MILAVIIAFWLLLVIAAVLFVRHAIDEDVRHDRGDRWC